MISRVWHGWTTPESADAYEALLMQALAMIAPKDKAEQVRKIILQAKKLEPKTKSKSDRGL